jgi:hypothetical protein
MMIRASSSSASLRAEKMRRVLERYRSSQFGIDRVGKTWFDSRRAEFLASSGLGKNRH